MSLKQAKPVPMVPVSIGGQILYQSVDVIGNNNYQAGGDLYTASQFGLSGVVSVHSMRSASGTYDARALFPSGAQNVNQTYAPTPQNFNLVWYYSANGVQVANNANLSAEIVRCDIMGVE